MDIQGHIDFDKDELETEFLRKRMDGLSVRLTLAFFFFVALLGVFLTLAYFYIERELENLKREQAEILSPDHVLSQKLAQLSEMGETLSDTIGKQMEELENARKDLKKNADALAARIKALEQAGDLKQAQKTLARLEANEKALTTKLGEMEKNFEALTKLPALVEGIQKENQSLSEKQKGMTTNFQAMQKKQKALEDEIALFPIDSVQKEELDVAVRRQDTERSSLENRVNRKLQQMQVLVDSLRSAPAGTGGISMPKQESLSE